MEVNYMLVFIAGNMFGDLCGIYDGAFLFARLNKSMTTTIMDTLSASRKFCTAFNI